MSQSLLPEDRVNEILEDAIENGAQFTAANDRYGDLMYIFDSWSDVEKLHAAAIAAVTPEEITEYAISDKQLQDNNSIDWIIGSEWSFSDSYSICGHCGAAICTEDTWPLYWIDYDLGDIFCADCVKSHYAEEYLVYCANHLAGNTGDEPVIARHFADPSEHGFVRLNNNEDYDNSQFADHPLVTDNRLISDLEYAKDEELARLDKARRIIDSHLQIVCMYSRHYSAYDFWARFEPDAIENAYEGSALVLEYAIGRVFAKYLTVK